MSTATAETTIGTMMGRILNEGYGPGAWHGPDLKAALADVAADLAFRRPGSERHNIAEIALHHAYCVHGVRAKLQGSDVEPFILEGDDWFALPDAQRLSWDTIMNVVGREHASLAEAVADINAGRVTTPLVEAERLDLVLGITCHAVYHAGQIQLIKKLSLEP